MAVPARARRLPDWIKVRPPGGENYARIKKDRIELGLATVCEEAKCPNISECWGSGTATFMVMGDTCTRGCRFCAVDTGKTPEALDPFEPAKLAKTIASMGLDYVVLTSVDRDDLPDQGAAHVAKCVELVRRHNPETLIEFLIPDFQGREDLLRIVLDAAPEVLAHNLETVARLTPTVRDRRASYQQSLDVLAYAKAYTEEAFGKPTFTKSSLMLGLGETEEEVGAAMDDLRAVGCDFLTLGQYLQPSTKHLQVVEFIHPDQFDAYARLGREKGFKYVASGPLVRSSYRAGEYYIRSVIEAEVAADRPHEVKE